MTLTDHAGKAETLGNCQETVTLNSDIAGQVSVCGLTWGHLNMTVELLRGCDLIIAADCFYDTKGKISTINISPQNPLEMPSN